MTRRNHDRHILALPASASIGAPDSPVSCLPRCCAGTRMNFYWLMLAASIVAALAGQVLLKAGAGAASFMGQLFDPSTLVGLVLYGGAAMLYIVALRRIPMSVALPCTAVSYVAATVIGHYAFGEAVTPMRVGAIAMICAGVVLLAAS